MNASHSKATNHQKEVRTLTIIKLSTNDATTLNIELTDDRGNSVFWSRDASGDWEGSWENRPDLGSDLVDALTSAGLTPAGIHIGDDEAFTISDAANINTAAETLRAAGFVVKVKK
jgi:hypothetical protein